jgi:hypothetical protein
LAPRSPWQNGLGEDEAWLQELSIDMSPEDGCLHIIGTGDESITAFTAFGVGASRTLSENGARIFAQLALPASISLAVTATSP